MARSYKQMSRKKDKGVFAGTFNKTKKINKSMSVKLGGNRF